MSFLNARKSNSSYATDDTVHTLKHAFRFIRSYFITNTFTNQWRRVQWIEGGTVRGSVECNTVTKARYAATIRVHPADVFSNQTVITTNNTAS